MPYSTETLNTTLFYVK